MVTCLKPNVIERIELDESCKTFLPATLSPLSSSHLHPWGTSRPGSPRAHHSHHAPGPAVHLHEHVPVHVPRRQEVAGRMERQPTSRRFQHDVLWSIPDPDWGFRGVRILLVAPILRGPLLARAVHAPDDSEPSTGRAVTPAISHAAGKAAQGTASASRGGRSRKWRQGVFCNPEKAGRLRRVWVEPAPQVRLRGSGTSVGCCGEFPGQLDGASVNPLLGHFA